MFSEIKFFLPATSNKLKSLKLHLFNGLLNLLLHVCSQNVVLEKNFKVYFYFNSFWEVQDQGDSRFSAWLEHAF